jgi:AcrR family transcriptional regulator
MGNREELIAGAKRCLIEKGFARTTARDIASASGVSLAAIGYHFGSKDALMMRALYELIGEWGEELERTLTENGAPARDPARRFESIWDRTIESFGGSAHGLWAAQLELPSLLGHNEELRAFLAGVQPEAAAGLAELFLGIDQEKDPETARTAGSVLHALLIGVMVKWFMDPKQALSGHDIADGLRLIAGRMAAGRRRRDRPAPARPV